MYSLSSFQRARPSVRRWKLVFKRHVSNPRSRQMRQHANSSRTGKRTSRISFEAAQASAASCLSSTVRSIQTSTRRPPSGRIKTAHRDDLVPDVLGPNYALMVSDLSARHVLRVTCGGCGHVGTLDPHTLKRRCSDHDRIVNLARRFRCGRSGTRGDVFWQVCAVPSDEMSVIQSIIFVDQRLHKMQNIWVHTYVPSSFSIHLHTCDVRAYVNVCFVAVDRPPDDNMER